MMPFYTILYIGGFRTVCLHIHKPEWSGKPYRRMRIHSRHGSSSGKLLRIHHAVCCSYPRMNQTYAANVSMRVIV